MISTSRLWGSIGWYVEQVRTLSWGLISVPSIVTRFSLHPNLRITTRRYYLECWTSTIQSTVSNTRDSCSFLSLKLSNRPPRPFHASYFRSARVCMSPRMLPDWVWTSVMIDPLCKCYKLFPGYTDLDHTTYCGNSHFSWSTLYIGRCCHSS